MPCLERLDGVAIVMRYRDHPPPHVHLAGGGLNVSITIRDRAVLAGRMPKRIDHVLHWIADHELELLAAWDDAQNARPIQPLSDYTEREVDS